MPPGLISHSCFALLLSDISAVYFRMMARRLYVFCKVKYESDWMYDIHSDIYVSTNKVWAQISLVLHPFSLPPNVQKTNTHTQGSYQILLRPFPPLHGRSSTTPHLHPGKHAAFNIYCNTLLLERDCWTLKVWRNMSIWEKEWDSSIMSHCNIVQISIQCGVCRDVC